VTRSTLRQRCAARAHSLLAAPVLSARAYKRAHAWVTFALYAAVRRELARARRSPSAPPRRACKHPDDRRRKGPRTPLRYGSAATEVCRDCGAWRMDHNGLSRWFAPPVDTKRDDDE